LALIRLPDRYEKPKQVMLHLRREIISKTTKLAEMKGEFEKSATMLK